MGLRDPISSASHLFFALWTLYALLILLRITPRSRQTATILFGGSMVLLYTTSGLFHGLPFTRQEYPREFRFFQKLDQSAIFILIAGTNTPLMTTFLNPSWRRWCLRVMWGLAFAGVVSLWILPKPPHEVIVVLCLAMGWLGVLPARQYYRALGWKAMNWALLGCFLYTLGAVCELCEWPVISAYPVRVGYHEVFHIFMVAASMSFFLFVFRYVIPYKPPYKAPRQDGVGEAAALKN